MYDLLLLDALFKSWNQPTVSLRPQSFYNVSYKSLYICNHLAIETECFLSIAKS